MYELIKIRQENGKQLVDARDLHAGLQVKSRFNDWINNQVERARLTENHHYVTLTKNLVNEHRMSTKIALYNH